MVVAQAVGIHIITNNTHNNIHKHRSAFPHPHISNPSSLFRCLRQLRRGRRISHHHLRGIYLGLRRRHIRDILPLLLLRLLLFMVKYKYRHQCRYRCRRCRSPLIRRGITSLDSWSIILVRRTWRRISFCDNGCVLLLFVDFLIFVTFLFLLSFSFFSFLCWSSHLPAFLLFLCFTITDMHFTLFFATFLFYSFLTSFSFPLPFLFLLVSLSVFSPCFYLFSLRSFLFSAL